MVGQIKIVALVLLAGAALVGCRDTEQGRRTSEDKGTYSGPRLDPLAPETVKALRERGERQKN